MSSSPLDGVEPRRSRAVVVEGHAAASRHLHGPLTARERAARLLDEDGSTIEWGPQAGSEDASGTRLGDGAVTALGRVAGKTAVVIAYDVTVDGGRQGTVAQRKAQKAIDVASQHDAPLFILAEGGDLRSDESALPEGQHDQIVDLASLSGRVPLIGVAFGPVYSTRALMLAACDVVFATPRAVINLADPAPPMPNGEQLALLQERSGLLDLVLSDDGEALAASQAYMRLLTQPTEAFDSEDAAEVAEQLRAIVPENPRRAFDAERLVMLLADPGTLMVLRAKYGSAVVTAFGRIGGRAVGFLANNPLHMAGAIDSPASDKMTRFIRICDTFGLPVVYLTDTPGLFAGPAAEQSAMARHSTRPYFALHSRRVPVYSVTVRRAFGQGPSVMAATGGGERRPIVQYSWPTAQWGGMGLGGAAAITSASAASRLAGETRDKAQIQRELVDHGSAEARASRFETDDVIDPGETRALLRAAVSHAPTYGVRKPRWPIDAW